MNIASVDSTTPWTNTGEIVSTALEIVLDKRTVILHWGQFIYAEGSDDEIRLAFASHDILIRGAGLLALQADVKAQHISSIYEPTRPDRFPGHSARFIREIEVRRIDAA